MRTDWPSIHQQCPQKCPVGDDADSCVRNADVTGDEKGI